MKLLYCFLLFGLAASNEGKLCPRYCICKLWHQLVRVDCVDRNIASTHLSIPRHTQVLDFSHNVISILRGNEFQDAGLKGLQRLHLHHNQIQFVDSLAFNGLQELQYLDLSHNHLRHVEVHTFATLQGLKVLNLSRNPFGLIMEGTLLSSTTLQVLNLARCGLAYLPNTLFQDLPSVTHLNISDNQIIKVDIQTLSPMENLQDIDVSANSMSCNSESSNLLLWLDNQRIKYTPFCEAKTREKPKMMERMVVLSNPMEVTAEDGSMELQEIDEFWEKEDVEKVPETGEKVPETEEKEKRFFERVTASFNVIPSFYSAVCGLQLGILIGAAIMYACIRPTPTKRTPPPTPPRGSPPRSTPPVVPRRTVSLRSSTRSSFTERASRLFDRDAGDILSLISNDTPPGTPPSPYQSTSELAPASFNSSTARPPLI